MKYANQLQNLGTETAFAVSAQAKEWADKGNKVYPFHLGDINLPTPENIVQATIKSINDGLTGYCPSEGILPLREALAHDVGAKRGELQSRQCSNTAWRKTNHWKIYFLNYGSWR